MEGIIKMDILRWLSDWLENDNTKVLYLLALILCANMLDFLLGWVNAKFNKEVPFSSSKAIMGITRKLLIFMVLVYFIPVSMLAPEPIGIGAIYVLFVGYLLSELNSILSHLKITDDTKSDVFADFIAKIFGQNKEGK